jgi:hypothetical protein
MRWLATLALLLLLPGCWFGGDFYAASDLRPALAPGRYRVVPITPRPGEEDQAKIFVVSIRGDGFTALTPLEPDEREDRSETAVAGFVPVDDANTAFAAWFERPPGGAETQSGVVGSPDLRPYALLRRDPDGSYRFLILSCPGPTEAAARAAGARPSELAPGLCIFPDRASLEAGLRNVPADFDDGLRFVPVP